MSEETQPQESGESKPAKVPFDERNLAEEIKQYSEKAQDLYQAYREQLNDADSPGAEKRISKARHDLQNQMEVENLERAANRVTQSKQPPLEE